MTERREGEPALHVQVQWSDDYRVCKASAVGLNGVSLSMSFSSPEPVLDAVARLRMEQAAVNALRCVFD